MFYLLKDEERNIDYPRFIKLPPHEKLVCIFKEGINYIKSCADARADFRLHYYVTGGRKEGGGSGSKNISGFYMESIYLNK